MISLKVATPTSKVFDGTCSQVEIKTISGNVTILPKHIAFVSIIKNGYIIIDKNNKIEIESAIVNVNQFSNIEILINK